MKQKPSLVEKSALARSGYKLKYAPEEKIGVIVVNNFPALGRLAALRFIEWTQHNPGGVISLPTGKTPQHFIQHVSRYLNGWNEKATRKELESEGIDPSLKPDMKSLHFVQIDEFYPIDPSQHNSFHYYVEKYYIENFNLDPAKAMLIDCTKIGLPPGGTLQEIWPGGVVDLSLRHRHPVSYEESVRKQVLQEVDQWCFEYGEKIRTLGGIGFFLGGIGPDGHIAFNVLGSDHHSTTRLTETNYETQAASASDLGGIEVARKRLAITIGLGTIAYNPDCTAIIIAAGEAKAPMIYNAVHQKSHIRYPATVLHKLPNARFYITQGAACMLPERQYADMVDMEKDALPEALKRRILIDLSLQIKKPLADISASDMKNSRFANLLLKKTGSTPQKLTGQLFKHIDETIEAGCQTRSNTVFLHTAPHHDDIMLGYFPYVVRAIRDASNTHHFTYLTSGFNAVTNSYALSMISNLKKFLNRREFEVLYDENYFSADYTQGWNRDVWQYLDGVAADSAFMKQEGEARRTYRMLADIFEEEEKDNLEHRINELINYFKTQYAGKKDPPYIQLLKGMIREWEADCLWGYLGFDSDSIHHLRLGFYKGEIFTEDPTINRDVPPILKLLKQVNPDVVTVALDPEASGPDTHYKVMQAVSEALKLYEKETGRSDIRILGYRNVWYRFHPAEADLYIPVSLNMFAVLQNAFLNAFVSQKDASFPSYEFDGPFSGLAQQIQVEQYQTLKTCMGRQYFNDHLRPLIRGTRGFVYLKELSLKEFYTHTRELRETTE
ncbi:PIG-L family deacetylase [bacterium]|nr:PIG-L family deacetylase [bacterium]